MKRKFLLASLGMASLLLAVPVQGVEPDAGSEDSSRWELAEINGIEVQEISPVQYVVSYTRRCNDENPTPIKFVSGDEVVIGVAVKHLPDFVCRAAPARRTLQIPGELGEPQTVRALK